MKLSNREKAAIIFGAATRNAGTMEIRRTPGHGETGRGLVVRSDKRGCKLAYR